MSTLVLFPIVFVSLVFFMILGDYIILKREFPDLHWKEFKSNEHSKPRFNRLKKSFIFVVCIAFCLLFLYAAVNYLKGE